MSYEIKTDYVSTTPVSSVDMNLRGDILQAQLPGAFEALGVGVLRATDLLAGTSTVAPGGAIIRNESGVPIYVRVPDTLPIPARGDGEYLHLVLRVPEYDDTQGTNSARGALPTLRISEDEEEPDALLLAQWDGEQWLDRRPLSNLALLAQLESDLGYDDDARDKGNVNERLAQLETPVDPTDPDVGITPVAFNALQNRVKQNETDIESLKAQIATLKLGADLFPAPFDILADEIAISRAGLAEVNPHSIERGQISVVVATAGHGQNDTPDYSPDTGDILELAWNGEEGVFDQ